MPDDGLKIQARILLKRAIYEKDQDAQKYVYLKYRRFIYQFIKTRWNFDGYTDDLVQMVFTNICDGKCQYAGNTDVQGYLCGIAKNVVQDHIRKEKYQIRISLILTNNTSIKSSQHNKRLNDPVKSLELKEIKDALHEAIARLPEKSRQAVILALIQGIRPYQAAEKVGCSAVSFRNRLHRGLKELQNKLNKSSNFFET